MYKLTLQIKKLRWEILSNMKKSKIYFNCEEKICYFNFENIYKKKIPGCPGIFFLFS